MRFRLSDRTIEIVVDAAHVAAHRKDFELPLGRVLGYVARALDARPRGLRILLRQDDPAWVKRWVLLPEVVGLCGVATAGRRGFWAYRLGRQIPSHLVHGRKRRTRRLTFYGRWEGPNRFLLRTVYAGDPAPREVHDPQIPLSEMPGSVAFWSRHAIVVRRGEYTPLPAAGASRSRARRRRTARRRAPRRGASARNPRVAAGRRRLSGGTTGRSRSGTSRRTSASARRPR